MESPCAQTFLFKLDMKQRHGAFSARNSLRRNFAGISESSSTEYSLNLFKANSRAFFTRSLTVKDDSPSSVQASSVQLVDLPAI